MKKVTTEEKLAMIADKLLGADLLENCYEAEDSYWYYCNGGNDEGFDEIDCLLHDMKAFFEGGELILTKAEKLFEVIKGRAPKYSAEE